MDSCKYSICPIFLVLFYMDVPTSLYILKSLQYVCFLISFCFSYEALNIDYLSQVQQPSGVLLEHDVNDLLFVSPNHLKIKPDRALGITNKTPANQYSRMLQTTSSQCALSESSSGNPSSFLSPPIVSRKKDKSRLVTVVSAQSAQESNPLEITCRSAGNEGLSM